jgi:hypothetical protein
MGETGYNARGGSNPSSSALAAGRLRAFRGDRTGAIRGFREHSLSATR